MGPPQNLLKALKLRYAEPQRHYHTWEHISALLTHYSAIEPELRDPEATMWALYWHDAIYDPSKPDNEDASADLLLSEASGLLSEISLARADRMIRATKQHAMPDDLTAGDQHDLQLFLDIDLSILAAREDVFDAYEVQIREEYSFVPDALYRQARGVVLSGFLKRERLYFSDHFFHQWEDAARDNLQRSIARLIA